MPATLAPAARSTCPAARRSPSAACAPSRPRRGRCGSPHSRTVTVASGGPTGTSGSAGFGMRSSRPSSSLSISPSCSSSASIALPISTRLGTQRVGACRRPPSVAAPTSALICLRCARRLSTSPSSRRRSRRARALVDERRRPRPCRRRPAGSRRRRRAGAGCRRSCAAPRTAASRRRDDHERRDRATPAASRRADRSAGRGTPVDARRTRRARGDLRCFATSKMSACHASPPAGIAGSTASASRPQVPALRLGQLGSGRRQGVVLDLQAAPRVGAKTRSHAVGGGDALERNVRLRVVERRALLGRRGAP